MKSADVRNTVLKMLLKTLEAGRTSSYVPAEDLPGDFYIHGDIDSFRGVYTSKGADLSENKFHVPEDFSGGGISPRDRAFLTRLYMGVLEKKQYLDFVIDSFSKTPVKKMKPIIRNILRMAAYQIIFMDSVPDRAAVSEAVNLAKRRGFAGLSGFVNGVLRAIVFQIDELSADKNNFCEGFPSSGKSNDRFRILAEYLQMPDFVLAGVPKWLYEKLIADLGKEDAAAFFKAVNSENSGVWVRLNLKISDFAKINLEDGNITEFVKNEELNVVGDIANPGGYEETNLRENIIKSLEADGCRVTEPFEGTAKKMPAALKISGFNSLTELNAFKRGQIFVQDINSQLAVLLAGELISGIIKQNSGNSISLIDKNLKSGTRNGKGEISFIPDMCEENNPNVCGSEKSIRILDVCAAPGGKSIGLALDYPEARITSCDVSRTRAALIKENITRLGIKNIRVEIRDALDFTPEFEEAFDIVIADLPCSGLGTIGHKPDIRWRIKPEDIVSLTTLQKEILANVTRYVRPGGALVYSVCTVTREECEGIAEYILGKVSSPDAPGRSMFKPIPLPEADCGCLKLIPGKVIGDGFFIARCRKI